jgi:hypothetical protein
VKRETTRSAADGVEPILDRDGGARPRGVSRYDELARLNDGDAERDADAAAFGLAMKPGCVVVAGRVAVGRMAIQVSGFGERRHIGQQA